MNRLLYILFSIFLFLFSCEKDIENGLKIVDLEIVSSDNEPIDSVLCHIEKNLLTAYSVITSNYTDSNGNCRLEFEYEYEALSPYYLQLDRFSSASGESNMTYAGKNKNNEYYRIEGNIPFLGFSKQNEFDITIKLVPQGKLHMLFETGELGYERIIVESEINGQVSKILDSGCNDTCCDSCYFDYYASCLDTINLECSLITNDMIVSNVSKKIKLEKFKTINVEIKF